MSQGYQPLHHKYRPTRFDELIGQEAIASTLKQALISNRIAPAYLFSGPRGTGKTSSARILARSLNCLNSEQPTIAPCGNCETCKTISSGTALDVIEIDAASNTGVESIRNLIDKSQFAPVQARWKVYVIDECHMLSTAAFNALLKTLEEPPLKVVFVLATTDPQRVLPTIISRCMRFDFRRIPLDALTKHLEMIANNESISIEKEALEIIAKKAQGGLRDAESMLDQLSLLPSPIKVASVWDLLGAIPEQDLITLADAIREKNPLSILETTRNLLDFGKEPIAIIQGLASIIRDMIITKAAPERPELCNCSKDTINKLTILADKIQMDSLLQWQAEIKSSEAQLRQSIQPRLWLEVIILGIISESDSSKNTTSKEIKNNKLEAIKLFPKNKTVLTKESHKEEISVSMHSEINDNAANYKESQPENNLSQKWSQIIAMLELPSTKMLLSQQAKLIKLTGEMAEIEVTSKWISMIESRKSLIEKAISKAIGGERKLILKTENINSAPKTNKSQQNQNFEKAKQSEEIETQKPKIEKKTESNQQRSEIIKNKSQEEPVNIEFEEKGSIDNNAEKFAEFFNGKIVDLED